MNDTTRAQKWNAETSAHPFAKNDRWAIVFDPTPGGIDNGDGTRTFSLRFPALFLSEYVDDPEQAAKDIAKALNEYEPALSARAETAEAALTEARAERDAAVAAALEMVAYEVAEAEEHDAAQNDWRDGEWLAKQIASGIRARTPADASSALAAMLAEAREEGRREADAEIERLREALEQIKALETKYANATVRRMVGVARAALTGEGGE